MLEEQFHLSRLIAAHLKGDLDSRGQIEFDQWMAASEANRIFVDGLSESTQVAEDLKAYNSLNEQLVWNKAIHRFQDQTKTGKIRAKNISIFYSAVAAAIALIIVGAGLYFYKRTENKQNVAVVFVKDIEAGTNKATLILPNGQILNLSAAKAGVVIQSGSLKYNDGTPVAAVEKANRGLLTTSTPRGGRYQVLLSDGTRVWLNAATTLKFPASFTGLNVRRVEVSGEAYFEVAKSYKTAIVNGKKSSLRIPFVVKTSQQETEVLGTHFNINAYADEAIQKTTLLEGAVRVSDGEENKILKPGEQAALSQGVFRIQQIDTVAVVAWKNGDFIFKNEPFENVLRQVSRWYDVEIINSQDHKDLHFSGRVSRSRNISTVLKALSVTGKVKFKIEGRRIIVIE